MNPFPWNKDKHDVLRKCADREIVVKRSLPHDPDYDKELGERIGGIAGVLNPITRWDLLPEPLLTTIKTLGSEGLIDLADELGLGWPRRLYVVPSSAGMHVLRVWKDIADRALSEFAGHS